MDSPVHLFDDDFDEAVISYLPGPNRTRPARGC